jgi:Fe-S cluster assembly protein SufB
MEEPNMGPGHYPKIDFQDLYYYAAPKNQCRPEVAGRGRSRSCSTYEKLGIPLQGAGNSRRREEAAAAEGDEEEVSGNVYKSGRVAVDAVFDSVSVVDDLQGGAEEGGRHLLSISEALRESSRSS